MKAIKVMGTIDEQGQLALDSPLTVEKPSCVEVIVLIPEDAATEADINLKEAILNDIRIVTVIFDSCYSGGATRGDGAIRGSRDGKPDTRKRPKDSAVTEEREELLKNWRTLTQKSKESWQTSIKRDYVFLGACRPHELERFILYNQKKTL